MQPQIPFGAITDEFTSDLEPALAAMAAIGMTSAELRVLWGKNIIALSDEEAARAARLVRDAGMTVTSIASPVLKCVLPGGPDVDTRFQQDVFNAVFTFDDQPRLFDRAIEVAHLVGAPIVRVFSYWRTVAPDRVVDAVAEALFRLASRAAQEGLIVGLENEHACNVATSAEAARILARVDHPNVKLVWDPANALCAGEERPFPDGYHALPAHRIAHVHAKDCHMEGHKPVWGPLGTRHVDWRGQVEALRRDGYRGVINLETHWPGPANDKMLASTICGWNLRGLVSM
jgi:sugar phosphate isomerase/epimerase